MKNSPAADDPGQASPQGLRPGVDPRDKAATLADWDARLQHQIAATDRVLAQLSGKGGSAGESLTPWAATPKGASVADTAAPPRDPLLDELLAMDKQGSASPDRLAAWEARMQARLEREEAEWETRKAEIERQYAAPPPPSVPTRGWRLVLAVMWLGYPLAGALLEIAIGSRFIFAFTDKYWVAAPWVLLGTFAAFMGLFVSADVRRRWRAQHPNGLRRWLLLPLLGGAVACGVFLATFGWAALLGWMAGGPVVMQEARVVSVGDLSKGAKGCDQSIRLAVNDIDVGLCLDGRMKGPVPAAGEHVLLVGRRSWFGMFVDEIRTR
jgi:hypothetical protein